MLATDPDYILTKRFGFSLDRLMKRYPEGAEDSVIAVALGITEAEVERRYQRIVNSLKIAVRPEDYDR